MWHGMVVSMWHGMLVAIWHGMVVAKWHGMVEAIWHGRHSSGRRSDASPDCVPGILHPMESSRRNLVDTNQANQPINKPLKPPHYPSNY